MQITVLGSYGEGNLGDEAILEGIRLRFPEASFTVFTHNLSLSLAQHPGMHAQIMLPAGIRSYLKQISTGQLKKSINILKESDLILIGGGGIFYDSKFSNGRNPVKVWYWRTKLLKKLGLKFELYCVGISKLKKEKSRKLMNKISELAERVSVCDKGSERNLREIGFADKIELKTDPAFDFIKEKGEVYSEYTVGISLRKWQEQNKFFEKALSKLTELSQGKNIEIKLIPMSTGIDDDRIVLREFKARLPEELRKKTELLELKTPASAYSAIAGLDYLIGMRLHSLIFAKLSGIKYFPLVYDEKIEGTLGTT